jgi:hypothetical protein
LLGGDLFNWNSDEYDRISQHDCRTTTYRASGLVQTGLPEIGLPPIVHGHDAQDDRENLKIELKSRVSEHLNDLKRLKWAADSFLKLD